MSLFCPFLNLKLACRSQAFDELSQFWDVCDDIDEHCAVLEPDPPNRIASHRRIALGTGIVWTSCTFYDYHSPLFIICVSLPCPLASRRSSAATVIMCLRRTPLLVAYQFESKATNAAVRYSAFGR